jgi:hypothetical protein
MNNSGLDEVHCCFGVAFLSRYIPRHRNHTWLDAYGLQRAVWAPLSDPGYSIGNGLIPIIYAALLDRLPIELGI